MQRYIIIRAGWAIIALWAVSILVFGLARITGSPTDTLLSFEASDEQRQLMESYWGLDKFPPRTVRRIHEEHLQGRPWGFVQVATAGDRPG